jgi:uncharacterized protein YndB with AHSA1/START domain
MVVIEMSETLPGPPEVVWELLTDWDHQGDWMLEASDFVVTSTQRRGIGVEAEATIKIGGIKTKDKVRVIGWEPGHRLAIRHLGWVGGMGEFFLTPFGENDTFLFWREELEPPLGLLGAAGLFAFKPLMRRVFQRDLKVLATLTRTRVESTGSR